MKNTWKTFVLVIAALGVGLGSPSAARQQPDQRVLANQLLGSDSQKREMALEALRRIKPEDTGVEVRAALKTLLEREASAHVGAYETGRQGMQPTRPAEPELVAWVSEAVARLRDPNFIPQLTAALGTGFTVVRALVSFQDAAVVPVAAAVESTASTHYQVEAGLTTLRMMVEQHPKMSPVLRARVRHAAVQRLTGRQHFTTVWAAIDLAIVLGDVGLRQVVSTLAFDRGASLTRGITRDDIVDLTQKRARDRLNGLPPMPRR